MMSAMLSHFHQRIAEKARDQFAAPVLIVALGDSVTHGCMELDVYDFESVYHAQLKRLLEKTHPSSTFSVINAGSWGDLSAGGLKRLERDVIRHQPDLILLAYGLNDACELGRERKSEFVKNIETMISRFRKETSADVIILTPPMMLTHDNDKVHAEHRQLVTRLSGIQNGGVLAEFAEALRQIGRRNQIAIADIQAAWKKLQDQGTDITLLLANGLNHPNSEMHRVAAEIILNIIQEHSGA
jgi:lysophospholipase L1-like esterase